MDSKAVAFQELVKIFKDNGYSLYLVGGTVRDFLLGKPFDDMDAVTDATPDEMKTFIPDADFTFSKMGSIRYKYNSIKFDITTLREEKSYKDSRHPSSIKFVKDLKIDVIRRDFSINGMYMDEHFIVYDYVNGREDLNNGIIKMIGNPTKRITEDPLRIIRAIRFAIDFDFSIDSKLEKAIFANIDLLKKLNIEKIKQDIKKIHSNDEEKKNYYFNKFGLSEILNVVE